MRVYIAARWDRYAEINEFADTITRAGNEVVSVWHRAAASGVPYSFTARAKNAEAIAAVCSQIASADVLVLCDSINPRGGSLIEYGIALGMGKRVAVIMASLRDSIPIFFDAAAIINPTRPPGEILDLLGTPSAIPPPVYIPDPGPGPAPEPGPSLHRFEAIVRTSFSDGTPRRQPSRVDAEEVVIESGCALFVTAGTVTEALAAGEWIYIKRKEPENATD